MKPRIEVKECLHSNFIKEISLARLEKVQSLIKDHPKSVILVPLGVDSRFNEGCREVANYLLFDLVTSLTAHFENREPLDEYSEDIIIAIKEDSVAVYCHQLIYDFMLPYMIHWKNLSVYCLHDEVEDQDAFEDYKIESFVSMVAGCEKVYIPYKKQRNSRGQKEEFDVFLFEKWPIVQAYAVEGVGKGVFFTMEFEVEDIYDEILMLINQVDPASFEKNIIESLCLSQRHWLETKSLFSSKHSTDITQEEAAEPLASFFRHGQLSQADGGDRAEQPVVEPFVRFGRFTSDEVEFEPQASVGDSGSSDGHASLHMVVRSVAPNTKLACTRTYFFPPHANASEDVKADYSRLQILYSLCCHACSRAMSIYCEKGSASRALEAALSLIQPYLDMLKPGKAASPPLARVRIEALARDGRWYELTGGKKEEERFTSVKRVSVVINHIPSTSVAASLSPSASLGSVAVADTFIDSYVDVMDAGGDVDEDDDDDAVCHSTAGCAYVVLTSFIGKYAEYDVNQAASGDEKKLKADVDDVVTCKNVYICSNSPLVEFCHSAVSIDFHLDSKRFEISSSASTWSAIGANMFADVKRVELREPDEGDHSVALLQFVLKEDSPLRCHPLLHTTEYRKDEVREESAFAIVVPAKSSALATIRQKLVPMLKEMLVCASSNGFSFTTSTTNSPLPALLSAYQLFCTKYEWFGANDSNLATHLVDSFPFFNLDASGGSGGGAITHALQPSLDRFRKHFLVSSVYGRRPVSASHLRLMMEGGVKADDDEKEECEGRKNNNNSKVSVTVVAGSPSAYVDQLCQSLVVLNRERVRWVVVRCRAPDHNPTQLDYHHLQGLLEETVAKRRSVRPGAAASKKLRVIVAANGYFDLLQVISSVLWHPDLVTRAHMKLSCVVACVEPNSSSVERGLVLPQVADHCAAGLCNFVAFTGVRKTESQKKCLGELQSYLRVVNPDAGFILAEKGHSIRPVDFDMLLSEDVFNQRRMLKTRLLSFPQLYGGKALTTGSNCLRALDVLVIEFYQPLFKPVFETRLRAINKMTFGDAKRCRVFVVKGVVGFIGGKSDELHEVTFSTESRDITYAAREGSTTTTAGVVAAAMSPAPPPSSKNSRNLRPMRPQTADVCGRKAATNNKPASAAAPYHVSFYGMGMSRGALMEWLRKCGRLNATRKVHKTRLSLKQQDLDKIQKAHETDPLPEGYFFNGTFYCNFFDEKRTQYHPFFDRFVDEHLARENKKVDDYNSKLKNVAVPDMFERV